jgi:hypothetical protein
MSVNFAGGTGNFSPASLAIEKTFLPPRLRDEKLRARARFLINLKLAAKRRREKSHSGLSEAAVRA